MTHESAQHEPRRGGAASGGLLAEMPSVYGWARRIVGRHDDAMDVVQEVAVRWIERAGDASPENPRAWLRRVTINRSIDALRRRGVRAAQPMNDAPEAGGSRGAGLLEGDDRDLLRMDVAAALGALSEMQRAVLVAKVFDGMTFDEVARELAIGPPTAKTHYLRAVRAVRDRLSRRWGPEGSLS